MHVVGKERQLQWNFSDPMEDEVHVVFLCAALGKRFSCGFQPYPEFEWNNFNQDKKTDNRGSCCVHQPVAYVADVFSVGSPLGVGPDPLPCGPSFGHSPHLHLT